MSQDDTVCFFIENEFCAFHDDRVKVNGEAEWSTKQSKVGSGVVKRKKNKEGRK